MKRKKTTGLSLVEVSVSVLILGMLAGMSLPQLSTRRTETREAAVVANLQMIQEAKLRWAYDLGKSGSDVPTVGDLVPKYLMDWPSEPAGRVYSAGAVGNQATFEGIPLDRLTNRIQRRDELADFQL
jgi:type II secretory pathway pseudopilin PulG